jgi:hypothetical protein
MTNNVSITSGSGTVIASDDVSGVQYQRVKLVDGTEDSSAVIPGDATNGLWVNVKNSVPLPVNQSVIDDLYNGSTANLGAGASFVGIATSTLNSAGIQISLKTDQNCTVYVEQSPGLGVGTGTVTTNGTTTLTGSGTNFLSRRVGDQILVNTETIRTIATIASDVSLTVTSPFSTTAGSLTYRMYNWDISDSYNYVAAINNFGITVQAINSYERVRVTNISSSTTTYFRLQTVLCPIIEPMPRSLDASGNFKVAVQSIQDGYGFGAENTPNGEQRFTEPGRLSGATFEGTTIDSSFWVTTVDATGGPGSITQANAEILLNSGTNAASFSTLRSVRRARYVSACPMRCRQVVQLGDTGTTNNTRRWGMAWGTTMPTISDGAYFQLSGTEFSVNTMKNYTGSTGITKITSFNGTYGSTYSPGTSVATYEIYWNNSKIYFVINGEVLHTVSASTATWAATMTFYIYMDNVNSGNTVNKTLECRSASIFRLGKLETSPNWKNFNTTAVTASVLKRGAGRLHKVTFNTLPNNSSVTLYDAITATNPIAVIAPPNGSTPFTHVFDLDFYDGLCITTTPNAINVTVIYE